MSRKNYPAALPSPYGDVAINTPLPIWREVVELTQGEDRWQGEGVIDLAWLPQPRIRFHVERNRNSTSSQLKTSIFRTASCD